MLRLSRLPKPATSDLALAGVLLAIKLAMIATGALIDPGDGIVPVLAAVAMTAPLAWRRTAPLAALATVAGAVAVQTLLVGWGRSVISFDVVPLACYSAGAHAGWRRPVVAVVAFAVATNVWLALLGDGPVVGNVLLGGAVLTSVPYAIGLVLGRERASAARQKALADRLATERDERARLAVEHERTRIARELHDLIAHNVSVIAIQADVARKALTRDQERADASLAVVAETARGTLAEMRRVLGRLREDGDVADLAPGPSLDQVEHLIVRAREAGLDVTLRQTGKPASVAPATEAAVYRVIQESLTNVLKHASGAQVSVDLRFAGDGVDVVVENDGPVESGGSGVGYGLAGMRERAALLGGSFEAGPRPEGGFAVTVHLPVQP